jgi:hypothetical protein
MPQTYDVSAEGLRFVRVHPYAIANRFTDIQDLRRQHYGEVFTHRSPQEVDHFVGRLSVASWSNPNAGIGVTARHGQRRSDPRVVAAFDERSGDLKGFMYAALNVSSRLEPFMSITADIGERERARKIENGRFYLWSNEYVHDPDYAHVVPVLAALSLEAYDKELGGKWYPWIEEAVLRNNLRTWGYCPNGLRPEQLQGEQGFGAGSIAAEQEPWTVESIDYACNRILKLPGAAQAVEEAHQSLAA